MTKAFPLSREHFDATRRLSHSVPYALTGEDPRTINAPLQKVKETFVEHSSQQRGEDRPLHD